MTHHGAAAARPPTDVRPPFSRRPPCARPLPLTAGPRWFADRSLGRQVRRCWSASVVLAVAGAASPRLMTSQRRRSAQRTGSSSRSTRPQGLAAAAGHPGQRVQGRRVPRAGRARTPTPSCRRPARTTSRRREGLLAELDAIPLDGDAGRARSSRARRQLRRLHRADLRDRRRRRAATRPGAAPLRRRSRRPTTSPTPPSARPRTAPGRLGADARRGWPRRVAGPTTARRTARGAGRRWSPSSALRRADVARGRSPARSAGCRRSLEAHGRRRPDRRGRRSTRGDEVGQMAAALDTAAGAPARR